MKRTFALFVLAVFVAALPEFASAQGRGGANKPVKTSRPVTQVKTQKPSKPTAGPRKATAARAPKTTPPPALPKNARLVERLQKLLPNGIDINDAAADFRSQGQFVAAVHASNNLNVPFEDLKSYMVDDGMSLGQAIKKLRPGVDAEQATTTATAQATADLGTTPAKARRK